MENFDPGLILDDNVIAPQLLVALGSIQFTMAYGWSTSDVTDLFSGRFSSLSISISETKV